VSAQRFSSLLIELSFLFDDFDGDTQDDVGVSSAVSISGTFVGAVADLQIIAKKSSCLCLGVGDQGLFLRSFELERVLQECPQFLFDLLRFFAGAKKPAKHIIGIADVSEAAIGGIVWISCWKLLGLS